ncbi:carboxylic acid reductase [Nocardia miyunensis]|uniref:carboxylic acid reductase n=1 Tax=Nocardia miyunensis TaxID=282684 RepID=UPI00082D013C|nr:carboxylic acid reductase [Nocardia miyunensis]
MSKKDQQDPQDRAARLEAELRASDREFREALPLDAVTAAAREPGLGLARTIERIMTGYSDRPAVAQRRTELVRDPETGRATTRLLPEFTTRTYGEVWDRARAVATGWSAQGIRPGEFIATIGFTSAEYLTLDLATTYLGAVAVPLQPSSVVPQLQAIVDETAPKVLATSLAYLDKALELALASPAKPRVLVFDVDPEVDDDREALAAATERLTATGQSIDTVNEIATAATDLPTVPLFDPEPGESPLTLLIYTSGSTGAPKGAMYQEHLVRGHWTGEAMGTREFPSITVNYMPMSHLMGRASIMGAFSRGGINYFTARADLSTLFEDIALARPTELAAVPRIFDMLFQMYQSELHTRSGEFDDSEQLDAAVKADLRDRVLGGRVLHGLVGSAPISAELKAFAQSCLAVPLVEGYGSTESGIVVMDDKVIRPPVIDYKLADVPELGYFNTDRPYPRGELLIKTENIFPGYYNRPDVTASMFDADGYYMTGDIMAETGPDELRYVDRRNNVQKLSQGEFVALSKVESVFNTNPSIQQIYPYGNSERPYLLAVIVPTEQALEDAGSVEALEPILAEALQRTAKEAGLEPYEIPRDFLIETEPFSMANGLLSDIRKLLRPRLRERYGDRLEQLYTELAQSEAAELQALRTNGRDQPIFETVARATRAMLGCSDAETRPDAHFTDLGGDSLSALSFSNLLGEIFEVEVPVSVAISPANDLRAIADYIAAQLDQTGNLPTFSSVHGVGATEIKASDLRLDKFIDRDILAAAEQLPAPQHTEPRTVFLTGATGYLGRFMCIDWLERLSERGGKLICIVRGSDDAAARKRLDDTFDTGDAELLAHYRKLAEKHLEVLAGDLGAPRLGLDEGTWNRLTAEVDVVMHPGALVNHVLPYDQMFGPNVFGTAELIRLAITTRLKSFTNVSTLGVADQMAPGTFDETTDIRKLSSVRRVHDGYANGYAMSKWAGEVLLREAHDAFGLPVTVFRSDMILAHSTYTGQLNVPDMFTRLMLTLVATGLAPKSFYTLQEDGTRPRAHYDGLPVDFSAEAVDTLGVQHPDGYRTYHLFNPHDDGISLDTYVDWLIDAGYAIKRVDDYADWLSRFETAIKALPEKQRRHSLLPLLHSYEKPQAPVSGEVAPTDEFRRAVAETGVGGRHEIPQVTPGLIVKYIDDLHQLDLL